MTRDDMVALIRDAGFAAAQRGSVYERCDGPLLPIRGARGSMTVEELKALLDAGEAPFVLDVREALELQVAPYPFPVHHVPMREVPQRLGEIPAGAEVVVACRSGSRSATVVQFLRKNGVAGAVNLDGGILAWSSRIDPSVPRY